jgi:hypothetical protein
MSGHGTPPTTDGRRAPEARRITVRAVLAILLLFGVYLVALLGVALAGGFIVLSVLSMRDYLQGETTSFSRRSCSAWSARSPRSWR